MAHVDIVKNEWLAGRQEVVARASLEDGRLKVVAKDATWEEIVRRPIDGLRPEDDPQAFLERLADAIHSSYLFATELHDDAECGFEGDVAPIHASDSRIPA